MINASDIEAFERDGVVAVRGLLTDWVEPLRDAIPELLETSYDPMQRAGYQDDIVMRVNDGMWRKCETFGRFLFHSPLGEVAAAVMGSQQAQLYEDLLLYRESESPGEVSWHRDVPHWPLRGNQLSSIWFTLEDVSSDRRDALRRGIAPGRRGAHQLR
jgi:hypothetical protein